MQVARWRVGIGIAATTLPKTMVTRDMKTRFLEVVSKERDDYCYCGYSCDGNFERSNADCSFRVELPLGEGNIEGLLVCFVDMNLNLNLNLMWLNPTSILLRRKEVGVVWKMELMDP